MFLQLGVSLIETLISLFLLSFILLGLDASLLTSLNHAKTNIHFAIAQMQINSLIEYISVTKNISSQIVNAWNAQNALSLPQGQGIIRGNYPSYEISISWGKIKNTECQHDSVSREGCLHVKV